jgi:hypothetical protein
MAVWHYKCNLVPKPTKEPLVKQITEDGFIPDVEEDWEWMNTGERLLSHVREQFNVTDSWSDEILMFGSEDDRIDIALIEDSHIVEYVSVRLDLRNDYWKDFLNRLIPIFEKLQLRVFDCYSFDIFDVSADNFRESIKNSNAIKFVTDPEKFLTSLSNDNKI